MISRIIFYILKSHANPPGAQKAKL